MNPALLDLLDEVAIVLDVAALSVIAALLIVFAGLCALWAIARLVPRRRYHGVPIEDMPGHLEHVPVDGPGRDEAFWDITETLLNGELADVCEQLGWMR